MNALTKGLVGAAVLLAGCVAPLDIDIDGDGHHHWGSDALRGSGHAATVQRSVHGFHRVEAWGVGRVVLERSGRERLRITGDDNLLEHIRSEVRGGTLFIGPESGVSLNPRVELVYRVDARALDDILGSGAVAFEADLGAQPRLRISLSGVCSITAEGEVDELEVFLSGVTAYRGLSLWSHTARVAVSGVSTAEVRVLDRLEADASGTSVIRYAGDPPEVVAHASGTATIEPW